MTQRFDAKFSSGSDRNSRLPSQPLWLRDTFGARSPNRDGWGPQRVPKNRSRESGKRKSWLPIDDSPMPARSSSRLCSDGAPPARFGVSRLELRIGVDRRPREKNSHGKTAEHPGRVSERPAQGRNRGYRLFVEKAERPHPQFRQILGGARNQQPGATDLQARHLKRGRAASRNFNECTPGRAGGGRQGDRTRG